MMKTFTQIKSVLFLISMLCVQNFLVGQAGPMKFVIDAPAEIAGDYQLYRSQFGPADNNEILNQPIKLGDPILGCSALTNSLTGTIGFLDRGVCNIIDKVRNGQNAGALAVIICTDDRDPVSATGTGTITIKSFMMEKPDCDKIKIALSKGAVSGSIKVRACEPLAPPNTIFGKNSGEGDFNGSIGGWKTSTEEGKGWEWTEDGDCGRGAFMFDECRLSTPTVCNGSMMMDSDYLNDQGICGAPCESSLISPTIDLSNIDVQGLFIQFNQGIRQLNSDYFLMLSYDNGGTWPDTVVLNTGIAANTDFFTNQKVRIPLCTSISDFDQITLRFHISGNYYFWGLDDIFLINESLSDPQVNNNFWASAPNVKTPANQVSAFPAMTDISNLGNVQSTNTSVNCKVLTVNSNGTFGTVHYDENKNYGQVAPCSSVENEEFSTLVDQPSDVGLYEIQYRISADVNQLTTNDLRTSRFLVTENEYSNALSEAEFGSDYLEGYLNGVNPAFAFGASNDPQNFSMGTHYFFPKGSEALAKTFTFGIDDADLADGLSANIRCSVYKILSFDEENPLELVPSQYVAVGKGLNSADGLEDMFVETTSENLRSLVFDLKNLDGGDLVFEDNSGYIFVIHVSSFLANDVFVPILGFNPNTSNNTLRWSFTAASDLAYDSLGMKVHYGTVTSQNATAIAEPSDFDNRSYRTNSPYKMYTSVIADLYVGTEDILSENQLSIYPNPTSDKLFIDMNLDKMSKNVRVEVYGIDGRRVLTQNFENIRTETLRINAQLLNNGVYTTKVITDEGSLTKKIIVSK